MLRYKLVVGTAAFPRGDWRLKWETEALSYSATAESTVLKLAFEDTN
jgi:hypothetical protein